MKRKMEKKVCIMLLAVVNGRNTDISGIVNEKNLPPRNDSITDIYIESGNWLFLSNVKCNIKVKINGITVNEAIIVFSLIFFFISI